MAKAIQQQQREVTPAQLQQQVREQVRQSLQDAQAQLKAAAEADARRSSQNPDAQVRVERVVVPSAPLPPLPPMEPMTPITVEPAETYTLAPGRYERMDDIPPRAQELGMAFFMTMAVIVIGLPIARAIGRLIDRRASAPALNSRDTQPQLVRIEQAVEAMAIEIERISESQRYLTRLQAGREEEALIPRRPAD